MHQNAELVIGVLSSKPNKIKLHSTPEFRAATTLLVEISYSREGYK